MLISPETQLDSKSSLTKRETLPALLTLTQDGSKTTLSGVWAFIDNNAGNAVAGKDKLGQNSAFAVYSSAQAGWDAIDNNLSRHAAAGHDLRQTMESYTPSCPEPCKNPVLKGNDPEGYARALAAAIGVQTTTKLSELSRGQLNDLVVAIGRVEGYFNNANRVRHIPAPTPEKK